MNDNIGLLRHEDFLQPFTLNNSSIRGRVVRLGSVIDVILNNHKNHDIVNKLLGELIVLSAMLSANLAKNGLLTVQLKGDGAISLLVADAVYGGSVRGYACTREETGDELIRKLAIEKAEDKITLNDLMGKGYLAITLDTGNGKPYQGIVEIEGNSLSDSIKKYFTNSEQIDVAIKGFVNKREREDGTSRWRAGGVMIERLPDYGGKDKSNNSDIELAKNTDNASSAGEWEYSEILLNTISEDEMLDIHLAPSALLYRLFNEKGVWVDDKSDIVFNCRCSRQKVKNMLASMDSESIEYMKIDGVIEVVCQFCKVAEIFNDKDLKKL